MSCPKIDDEKKTSFQNLNDLRYLKTYLKPLIGLIDTKKMKSDLQLHRVSQIHRRSFFLSTVSKTIDQLNENPEIMSPYEIAEFIKQDIIGLNLFISFKKMIPMYQTFKKMKSFSLAMTFNYKVLEIFILFFNGADCSVNLPKIQKEVENLNFIIETLRKEETIGQTMEKIIESLKNISSKNDEAVFQNKKCDRKLRCF